MRTNITISQSCTTSEECQDIMFIQGDVVEVLFVCENLNLETVKGAILKSENADLRVECPYSSSQNGFSFKLESEKTNLLKPTIASYDLLLEFNDGNSITLIHEAGFAILKKRNNTFTEVEP